MAVWKLASSWAHRSAWGRFDVGLLDLGRFRVRAAGGRTSILDGDLEGCQV